MKKADHAVEIKSRIFQLDNSAQIENTLPDSPMNFKKKAHNMFNSDKFLDKKVRYKIWFKKQFALGKLFFIQALKAAL